MSEAPEVAMIVFLKDPMWMDETVTELSQTLAVGDTQLKWSLVKPEIDAFILYTDEERQCENTPLTSECVT